MFSGYFPPTDEQLRTFIRDGLVVLDTSALLDTYRFTEDARTEYLDALALLGDRLWIPNRTAEEFFDNRENVIASLVDEREETRARVLAALATPTRIIAWYGRRRGATQDQVLRLTALLEDAVDKALAELDDDLDDEFAPKLDHDDDPVFARIEALVAGRIGAEFELKDRAGLTKAFGMRMAADVPPGFKDEEKGSRAIGDFLVWEQTVREAKARKMPVLMIINEIKADWTRREGDYLGPRPELVREMAKRAGQEFHLVDVHTFLTMAAQHLAAEVSEDTVAEATRLAIAAAAIRPTPLYRDMTAALNGPTYTIPDSAHFTIPEPTHFTIPERTGFTIPPDPMKQMWADILERASAKSIVDQVYKDLDWNTRTVTAAFPSHAEVAYPREFLQQLTNPNGTGISASDPRAGRKQLGLNRAARTDHVHDDGQDKIENEDVTE